jgi:heme exporter protein A
MLEAIGLSYFRDDQAVFRGVNFVLAQGQVLHVQGGNGAGKTTLLRVLCGLLSPEEGELRWQGCSLSTCVAEFRRQLVYLGHAPGIKDILTPRENLTASLRLAGVSHTTDDVGEALAQVGLSGYEDTPSFRLSAGQRRRAALARLWAQPDALWVLDEPFSALDKHGVAQLEQRLAFHVQQGGCAIVTTHQHEVLPLGNVVPFLLSRAV